MTWTWDAIREHWPQVVDLAYNADTIVDAFNRVERVLGPKAIEHSGPHGGTYPVLSIVCDGRRLGALDGVERTDAFVRGLARGDVSSWTELEALYILRAGPDPTAAHLHPPVAVGNRTRAADLRIRRLVDDPWTYVEVTRPRESKARLAVADLLRPDFGGDGRGLARGLTLHLHRAPSDSDLDELRAVIVASNASETSVALDLPNGLGSLVVRVDRPGGGGGSSMIRWVVPDPRGVGIVQRKAAQLPTGTPTLVMVDVTSTLTDWSRSIESYLASGRHSWVSAVCLFTSGFAPAAGGEAWSISVRLIENPSAAVQLPGWIRVALEQFVASGVDRG